MFLWAMLLLVGTHSTGSVMQQPDKTGKPVLGDWPSFTRVLPPCFLTTGTVASPGRPGRATVPSCGNRAALRGLKFPCNPADNTDAARDSPGPGGRRQCPAAAASVKEG